MTVDAEKFNQLLHDVAFIKQRLNDVVLINEMGFADKADSEGEITDWVKKELDEARQVPDSELISSEEVKRMILAE